MSQMNTTAPVTSLLLLGHPGHELRLLHWVECTRPLVAVMTDGSGSRGEGRVASTRTLLARVGAHPLDPLVGIFTDRDVYRALLDVDVAFFWTLAERICASIQAHAITTIASDAIEHYNPTHDVCCLVAHVVTQLTARRSGRRVTHLAFPLVGAPGAPGPGQGVMLALDEAALDRKIAAARDYVELRRDVDAALAAYGSPAFGTETLSVVDDPFREIAGAHSPYYERVGRERQASGTYREVITLADHMRPLAEGLQARLAAGTTGPSPTRPSVRG